MFVHVNMSATYTVYTRTERDRILTLSLQPKDIPKAPALYLHSHYMQLEWDRIPKEVCRNLIESMPRRIEAVIKAKGAQTKTSKKTDSFRLPNCKIYIKPIAVTKVLYFGVTKGEISGFVIRNSYGFTFVP